MLLGAMLPGGTGESSGMGDRSGVLVEWILFRLLEGVWGGGTGDWSEMLRRLPLPGCLVVAGNIESFERALCTARV